MFVWVMVGLGGGGGGALGVKWCRRGGGGPSKHQEGHVRSSGALHTATQRDVSEGQNH